MSRLNVISGPRTTGAGVLGVGSWGEGFVVLVGQSDFTTEILPKSFTLQHFGYDAAGLPVLQGSTDISALLNGGFTDPVNVVGLVTDEAGNSLVAFTVTRNDGSLEVRVLKIDASGGVIVPETLIHADLSSPHLFTNELGGVSLILNSGNAPDDVTVIHDIVSAPGGGLGPDNTQVYDGQSPTGEILVLDDGNVFRIVPGSSPIQALTTPINRGQFAVFEDETDRFDSLFAVGNRILDIDREVGAGGVMELRFDLMERGKIDPVASTVLTTGQAAVDSFVMVAEIQGTGFAILRINTELGDAFHRLALDVFDLEGDLIRSLDLAGQVPTNNFITDFRALSSPDFIDFAILGSEGSLSFAFNKVRGLHVKLKPALDIQGTTSDDDLFGRARADRLDGLAADDNIRGNGGADTLIGGAGDDTLLGGVRDDLLQTGAGDDIVSGGAGNDTIIITQDNDVLTGGSGADRFIFRPAGPGLAFIEDFTQGQDRIVLDGVSGFSSFADLTITSEDGVLRFALADLVVLVDAPALAAGDFLFL